MQANLAIDSNGFYEALVGTVIAGRYELRQFIKVGGSSGVFDGLDRVMSRRVAVKMMPAGDTTMEHRFEREAQILSRLRHPNTLTVYDFGRAEKGGSTWLFMVMELLEGQSLKELLRDEGALPPRRAARIVSQICRSLHDAHRHGVVHRDIKPSNVFLVHVDDDPEFVKVLDFGVARLLSIREDPVDHDMTQAGRIIGTPRYMSPEQISSQPVDPRADVYSTGVMLYEMITGRVPFEDTTLGGLLILHLKEAPPPFATRDFPYADDVTPELEAAVMRALNKRPEDRFQGIEDLRLSVEAAVGMSSPRAYAERRSMPAADDLGMVLPPPPVPVDAMPPDPEGIVLDAIDPEQDPDDPPEAELEPTHFVMAPRARVARPVQKAQPAARPWPGSEPKSAPRPANDPVARPRPTSTVAHIAPGSSQRVVVPVDDPIEDAIMVDPPVEAAHQRRVGRWVAVALFVVLAGTITLTVALPSGDVPRVTRLRGRAVALGGVGVGALPSLVAPAQADSALPGAPTGLELAPTEAPDAPGASDGVLPDGAPEGALPDQAGEAAPTLEVPAMELAPVELAPVLLSPTGEAAGAADLAPAGAPVVEVAPLQVQPRGAAPAEEGGAASASSGASAEASKTSAPQSPQGPSKSPVKRPTPRVVASPAAPAPASAKGGAPKDVTKDVTKDSPKGAPKAGSGESAPKAAESSPQPAQKQPAQQDAPTKTPVVPLLDDLPSKGPDTPKVPRVAAPVVPLLD